MKWLSDFLDKILNKPEIEKPIPECELDEDNETLQFALIVKQEMINELQSEIIGNDETIKDQKIEIDKYKKMIQIQDAEIIALKARIEELTPKGIIGLELMKGSSKELKWVDNGYRLSKDFTVGEFMQNDSLNYVKIDMKVVEILQKIRSHFNKVLSISSGYRSQAYNDALDGSVPTSHHIKGEAADFKVSGVNKNTVLAYVKSLPEVAYAYTNNTTMRYSVHINI